MTIEQELWLLLRDDAAKDRGDPRTSAEKREAQEEARRQREAMRENR